MVAVATCSGLPNAKGFIQLIRKLIVEWIFCFKFLMFTFIGGVQTHVLFLIKTISSPDKQQFEYLNDSFQ